VQEQEEEAARAGRGGGSDTGVGDFRSPSGGLRQQRAAAAPDHYHYHQRSRDAQRGARSRTWHPGGDARMFVGVSKVFSQQLWKFTGYVPKVLHIESNELAPWPYEDGFSHLLPDSSSSPQHKLVQSLRTLLN